MSLAEDRVLTWRMTSDSHPARWAEAFNKTIQGLRHLGTRQLNARTENPHQSNHRADAPWVTMVICPFDEIVAVVIGLPGA